MFASETASTLTTRGEYADDKRRTLVSSYNMTDSSWAPVAERAFVAGSFVWTGFDYKGEPTPYKWPCISSHFGIMDSCGFPKDNYYYYQSWWKTDPVVHIMPHWNWRGREGQEIKVMVFSNCEKVELFLDGQSLGTRTMPQRPPGMESQVCRRQAGGKGQQPRPIGRRRQSRDNGRTGRVASEN